MSVINGCVSAVLENGTIVGQSENIGYVNIDHSDHSGVISSLLILIPIVNIPIISCVHNNPSNTFINKLVIIDCLNALGYMPILLQHYKSVKLYDFIRSEVELFRQVLQNDAICFAEGVYNMFTVAFNRNLPVVIAFHRYIYVFHWTWVYTDADKRKLSILLSTFLFLLPICSAVSTILYIENNWRMNVCMGREENFFYDFKNIFNSYTGVMFSK